MRRSEPMWRQTGITPGIAPIATETTLKSGSPGKASRKTSKLFGVQVVFVVGTLDAFTRKGRRKK